MTMIDPPPSSPSSEVRIALCERLKKSLDALGVPDSDVYWWKPENQWLATVPLSFPTMRTYRVTFQCDAPDRVAVICSEWDASSYPDEVRVIVMNLLTEMVTEQTGVSFARDSGRFVRSVVFLKAEELADPEEIKDAIVGCVELLEFASKIASQAENFRHASDTERREILNQFKQSLASEP